jgi:hypothetical protein
MKGESAMRNLISFATLVGILAIPAMAAGIDGKWKGEMPSRDGNAREVSFQFKAEAAKLTGHFMGPMGREIPIQDGRVSGDSISFFISLDFNGNMVKIGYTGKLSSGNLNMKMQREGASRSVEFTLKRAGD